jgi:polyhydroxyalkanoate synthesis regulator phasin
MFDNGPSNNRRLANPKKKIQAYGFIQPDESSSSNEDQWKLTNQIFKGKVSDQDERRFVEEIVNDPSKSSKLVKTYTAKRTLKETI